MSDSRLSTSHHCTHCLKSDRTPSRQHTQYHCPSCRLQECNRHLHHNFQYGPDVHCIRLDLWMLRNWDGCDQKSSDSDLHFVDPREWLPANMLCPSFQRLRWMWQLEPGWAASGFAIKVTDTPVASASSFKHCTNKVEMGLCQFIHVSRSQSSQGVNGASGTTKAHLNDFWRKVRERRGTKWQNDTVQITFAIGSSKITEIRHVVMTFSRYQKWKQMIHTCL
jgi:hypothetical protein